MKISIKTILIIGAGVCTATAALAQGSSITQTLNRELAAARAAYVPSGQRPVLSPRTDSLNQGGEDQYNVQLVAGRSYTLVGVCDGDCTDLDIALYDENNNLIDQDTLTDDRPIVKVTPRRSARFRMEVTMASCSDEPCYYAVAVYGR
jgi:hypothetical protein